MFDETLRFVQEAALPYLHVFPYSERPGTPAARMPAVPKPVRKERAAALREAGVAEARRFFAGQIGRVGFVADRGRPVRSHRTFRARAAGAAAGVRPAGAGDGDRRDG